jgi:hypothetical protein
MPYTNGEGTRTIARTVCLLALLPTAAIAQATYDYTSGAQLSLQQTDPSFTAPAILTGFVTLPNALPQNGTVTVTPLAFDFVNLAIDQSDAFGNDAPVTFTTDDGNIVGWSVSESCCLQNPNGSTEVVLKSNGGPATYTSGDPLGGVLATYGEGSWAPAAHAVPEIDFSQFAGITLAAGILAIIRGRKPRRA